MLGSLSGPVHFFLDQGHLAVRTFFVLSGFVLTAGYGRSQWSRRNLLRYGVARFARIFPVYLLSLAIVAYFMFKTGTAREITTYVLVLQGWMSSAGTGWNTPAWSLSCEFFFYLCLPPVLIWLGRTSKWRIWVLALIALVLSPMLRRAGMPLNWKPILHLGDFMVGIVAARIYTGIRFRRRGYWLYLPAIACGLLFIVFPNLLAGVTDLGTVLRPLNGMLVLGLALGGGVLARFLSTVSAQYLGQVSYSMYILHVPLLWWYGTHQSATIYIVGVILASAAAFEWVEKPANRWLRHLVETKKGPAESILPGEHKNRTEDLPAPAAVVAATVVEAD